MVGQDRLYRAARRAGRGGQGGRRGSKVWRGDMLVIDVPLKTGAAVALGGAAPGAPSTPAWNCRRCDLRALAGSGATNDARRGRFITLEGGEGARQVGAGETPGARLKATGLEVVRDARARRLAGRRGTAQGDPVRLRRPLGPDGEALLFAAARIDHLDKTILPALARGAWVVCDRFANSTRAYQGAAGKLDRRLHRAARAGRRRGEQARPDADSRHSGRESAWRAPPTARRGRGPDRFEAEGLAFHETLRRAFLDIAAAEPERCAVIDATRAARARSRRQIWSAVEARLDPAGAL